TVASYLFVRGLERPSWTVWIAYAIVSALAAYAHFFALLVPLAHATSLLFVRPELLPWRKLVGSACLLVVLLGFLIYLIASTDPSHRPLFVVRYFTVCLPPVVLLVSFLVARIRRAALAATAVAALAAASLAGVVRWYALGEDEDWRDATRFVLQSAAPGDGVLLYA